MGSRFLTFTISHWVFPVFRHGPSTTFHHLKVGKKNQDSGADVTFSISDDAEMRVEMMLLFDVSEYVFQVWWVYSPEVLTARP